MRRNGTIEHEVMTKTTIPSGPHLSLFLASGEAQNTEAAAAIRTAAGTIVTAVNSMLDYLEEPLKGQFLKVKNEINTMLAGMPATDAVPAAMESNYVLKNLMYVLSSAQSMMTSLSEAATGASKKAATALNSLPGEIEKGIEAKVTAGEFIKKDDLPAKIDAAVTLARTGWENGAKLVNDRTKLLTTASLPVPDAKILSVEEKDWTPKQETAKTRAEKLKPFKVEGDTLLQLCWDATQGEFDRTFAVLEANKGPAATARKTATPFVTPSSNGKVIAKVGMC